ncbi:MAG: NRDE family protein, partial [Phycisphaerae bacterium]
MCTVTVVPIAARPGGSHDTNSRVVRIACNRDELRTRPIALPPRMQSFGARRAILPIDPASGGTWIALSDVGVLLTVLNVNVNNGVRRDAIRPGELRSRGTIIPELLALDSLEAIAAAAARLSPSRYPPFRLLIINQTRVGDLYSDGRELRYTSRDLIDDSRSCSSARGASASGRCELSAHRPEADAPPGAIADVLSGARPFFYTSSGLGDSLVDAPRRELFERSFSPPLSSPTATQDAFHRHSWPDRRHL